MSFSDQEMAPIREHAALLIDSYVPSDTGDGRFDHIAKDYGGLGTTCGYLCHWLMWRLGSDNTVWPGVKEVKDRGDSSCRDAVRQWLGYPTTWRYGWQWPSYTDWTKGQRFGYCWAQFSG